MLTTLKNGRLTVTADTRGAELQTIDKDGGPSYLWSGDPAFWAFHAPTLFPIIGALRGGRALSAAAKSPCPSTASAVRPSLPWRTPATPL